MKKVVFVKMQKKEAEGRRAGSWGACVWGAGL